MEGFLSLKKGRKRHGRLDAVDTGSRVSYFCVILSDAQSGNKTGGNSRSIDRHQAVTSQFRDKGLRNAVVWSAFFIYYEGSMYYGGAT